MPFRLKPSTRTIGRRLSDWTCRRLDRVHNGLAGGFRAVGRGARVLVDRIAPPARLAILLVLLAGGFALVYWGGWQGYLGRADLVSPELKMRVLALDILDTFDAYALGAGALAAMMGAMALLAFLRRRIVLHLLRAVAVAQLAGWLVFLGFVLAFPAQAGALYLDQAGPTSADRVLEWQIELWLPWTLLAGAILAVSGTLVVCTWQGGALEYYTRKVPQAPLVGDRLYENIRTHGKDRRYRTSLYWPLAGCAAYLLALTAMMMIRGCGWEKDYDIPYGSGTPTVTVVQIKQIKRKKPEKLVLNMDSPIIWTRPKLTDIDVLSDVDEATSEEYQANRNIGKLGAGGGDQGGWPYGVANATVRFIRLRYSGGNWDWNSGHGGDYNMLLFFNKITGFKIAGNTEFKDVARLARFRKGKAPPFVYMTGTGRIHLNSRDAKVLRDYCLVEGGLIFGDAASATFHHYFAHMCRTVFPGASLVDIPDDDPIFREPFSFPNGAPPLWHHGGHRALGIKHEGRWVVFYHPGDMGDAWKTGHSGASDAVAQRALKLGINIMYYTFTRYLAKHHPPE